MNVHEAVIAKIQCLPETLAQEALDYVDFLKTSCVIGGVCFRTFTRKFCLYNAL